MFASYQSILDYKAVKRQLIEAGIACLEAPSAELNGNSLAEVFGQREAVDLAMNAWSDCVLLRLNVQFNRSSNSLKFQEIISDANELFWLSIQGERGGRLMEEFGKAEVNHFGKLFERHLAETRDIIDAANLTVRAGRNIGPDRIRILRHIDQLRNRILDACGLCDHAFFESLGLNNPVSSPEGLCLAEMILSLDRSESMRDGLKKPRLASNRFNNIVSPQTLLGYFDDLCLLPDIKPLAGQGPFDPSDVLCAVLPSDEDSMLDSVIWDFVLEMFFSELTSGEQMALLKFYWPLVSDRNEDPCTWLQVAQALSVKDTRTAKKRAAVIADNLRQQVLACIDGIFAPALDEFSIEERRALAWWMKHVRKSAFFELFGRHGMSLNRVDAAKCLRCKVDEVIDIMNEIEKRLLLNIQGLSK